MSRLIASVERKSLVDMVASLTRAKLRYQVGDLAALSRAAAVIEDRYAQLFKLGRWQNVPVVFCKTRQRPGMDLPVSRHSPRLVDH